MEGPLLIIIVPVYNIIEYLPRCVYSITDQTYYNFEQKSRGFSPSLISVHSDSNQFGDDMVLGDIEVIPLD